jgi:Protein of unknown function (DUF2878)
VPAVSRLAICFGLGALIGTLLDGIHLYGDVESYPDPDFGRWAWFVPLEFGLAGAVAGASIPLLEQRVGPSALPDWNRAAELVVIVAAYLCTVVLDGLPVLVTVLLVALLGVRLTFRPVAGDWAYALIAAVAGPAVEATLSALDAFEYADPDFAGIPVWLPALWANGGIFIRRFFGPIVWRAPQARSTGL